MECRSLTNLKDKVATDITTTKYQIPNLMRAIISGKSEWRWGKSGQFRMTLPKYVVAVEIAPRREFAGPDGTLQGRGQLMVRIWHLIYKEE
jgi:hypothetical protein